LPETEVEDKQDDEVAELGLRLKKATMLNKMHYFTPLTSETFYTTVMADHSHQSLMLLFYVTCKLILANGAKLRE
jgi:hypothetical protein